LAQTDGFNLGTFIMTTGSSPSAADDGRIGAEPAPTPMYPVRNSRLKRLIDIVLSLGVTIAISPLLLTIFLLIRILDRGPALFRQARIGRDGRVFIIYKFRTMHPDADARLNALLMSDPAAASEWRAYQKLRNDPRITPIGRFLRRSSLDELPQLINILRGDMGLIGPRPVAPDELQRYGQVAHVYTAVRPGVLGLWQVRGRNHLTYAQRVALDGEYVRNWSILTDLRILLEAIPVVLFGKGAY